MADPQDRFISTVVAGKSFADVGGLWGTVNEKVSVARAYGAATVAMIDLTPLTDPMWTTFIERVHQLGVSDVQCISHDALGLGKSDDAPIFDVVHCSGVLYHMPN